MRGKFMLIIMLLLVLAGCGGGPKADVLIFMTGSNGIPNEVGDKLQAALQSKLGEAPTVKIQTTPMFSMDKLVVEIAAGDNSIIIVPTEQFKTIGQQGGYISLDDVAKQEDFPGGVLELPVETKEKNAEPKKEKHLYGIPLEQTQWFTELKLNGKDLVAFVPANAKNPDKAMQVMKIIAQK